MKLKKSLGQHFLKDQNILKKIAGFPDTSETKTVLEVGPGGGALTKYLAEIPDIDLYVVEKDSRMISGLKEMFEPKGVKVIHDDFLNFDIRKVFKKNLIIAGNFPYNVSSLILIKVLENVDLVAEMVGMFQKEVADRVVSPPGSKKYGILSVLVQAFYDCEKMIEVSAKMFDPPPKVQSAVIKLRRKRDYKLKCDRDLFFRIVKTAFNQRRKTLKNSLKIYLKENEVKDPWLAEILQKRPETLSVADFVNLTLVIENSRKGLKKRGSVIITDEVHPLLREGLSELGFECDYVPEMRQEELEAVVGHYNGVIINSKTRIDKELMDKAGHLQFIGRLGSGMEIIDKDYAEKKGIACINSPEGNRNAVAEHALGGLLALMNHINRADRQVRQKIWQREENRGDELEGKVVGIMGFGNTGSTLAKLLQGFDVEVLAYDKYKSGFSTGKVRETDMEEIFERAEIVSLHLPLTDETKFLVSKEFINKFKNKIYLINTARGKIVRTDDLIQGLGSGKIKGAVLDVLENEKLDQFDKSDNKWFSRLVELDNVIITPHIAGWTFQSKEKIAGTLLEKIKEKIENK